MLAGLDIDLVIRNYFMFIFNLTLFYYCHDTYLHAIAYVFFSFILFIWTVTNDSVTILIYL